MEKKIVITLTDDVSKIRNEGLGDYKYIGDELHIYSYLKDESYYNEAWLIALHELIEQRLTEQRGIKEEDIDAFDRFVLENGGKADEGGNEEMSPYKREHRFAENIERQLCHELGLDWFNYYNYER
jgi:hypothetical protein